MTPGRFVIFLILCGLAVVFGPKAWLAWQLTQPGFHDTSCWFSTQTTGETRCGYMVVRENRQDPKSRTIKLPVVIFEAVQESRWRYKPPKTPILYVTGGPGGSARLGSQEEVESWWYERQLFPIGHPLIVMGQRGTGRDEPDFDCEEFDDPAIALGAHSRDASPPVRRPLFMAAATACVERLREAGIDLTAYNSRESAADIAELRRALGIERWNLYGISYGTRLVLSTLRYHPEGIRAVILDSVYPPEARSLLDRARFYREALQRLFADCATNFNCSRNYGDIKEAYDVSHQRLREQTITLDLKALDSDLDLVISIDHRKLDELLFDALYFEETREMIPHALRETADFHYTALRNLKLHTLEGSGSLSTAVNLSHICNDEAPFESPTEIAAAAREAGSLSHMITESGKGYVCAVWPAGSPSAAENTPVESPVPALLLSGSFDPITPPLLARSAAAQLSTSYVFELAEAGHGAFYESECAQHLVAEFLAMPIREPGGDCKSWEVVGSSAD